jgi:hypothetical protein
MGFVLTIWIFFIQLDTKTEYILSILLKKRSVRQESRKNILHDIEWLYLSSVSGTLAATIHTD